MSVWKWIKWLCAKTTRTKEDPKTMVVPPPPRRRNVDTDAIRARIKGIGYQVTELPIRRKNPQTMQPYIAEWKLVAYNGLRSLQATGPTIDEAMKNIGQMLGVIPRT